MKLKYRRRIFTKHSLGITPNSININRWSFFPFLFEQKYPLTSVLQNSFSEKSYKIISKISVEELLFIALLLLFSCEFTEFFRNVIFWKTSEHHDACFTCFLVSSLYTCFLFLCIIYLFSQFRFNYLVSVL